MSLGMGRLASVLDLDQSLSKLSSSPLRRPILDESKKLVVSGPSGLGDDMIDT